MVNHHLLLLNNNNSSSGMDNKLVGEGMLDIL